MSEAMQLLAQAILAASMDQATPPMKDPNVSGCESGLTACDQVLKSNWNPNDRKPGEQK